MILLQDELGYKVSVPEFKYEILQGDLRVVSKEIKDIQHCHSNGEIRARHFSFIDFHGNGMDWTPDWFSMVRDPVERVILPLI